MTPEQESVFWEIIETFNNEDLLPHVMLIGSWAEFLYSYYLKSDFKPSLRTTDADFLFKNLRVPKKRIFLSEALKEKGFTYVENRLTGVGKYVKEGLLEIEFLVRVLGSGDRRYEKIPSIDIVAVGLREVNILAKYPLQLECNGYTITVPEPEAYVIHKLIINPKRENADKKEKDIRSVESLLRHVDKDRLEQIYKDLTKKERITVNTVCDENVMVLF